MPLLVHCPNRCQIRVPSNRMGKVIRCVDCQTPIRIPEIESPLLRTGNWVECRAKRAIKKSEIANSADFAEQTSTAIPPIGDSSTLPAQPVKPSTEPPAASNLSLTSPQRTARLLRAKPWRTVEPLTTVDPEDVLTPIDLDDNLSAAAGEGVIDTSETSRVETFEKQEADTQPRRRLSLIGKLLRFINPFAKDPLNG